MKAVFPLWKKDTKKLMDGFIENKFRTITCCINDSCLGEEAVGKEVDAAFIRMLPADVDPCGENGEFHTFCYAGPVFKYPVPFQIGEKVYKPLPLKRDDSVCKSEGKTKGFWFCDLIPVNDGTTPVQ